MLNGGMTSCPNSVSDYSSQTLQTATGNGMSSGGGLVGVGGVNSTGIPNDRDINTSGSSAWMSHPHSHSHSHGNSTKMSSGATTWAHTNSSNCMSAVSDGSFGPSPAGHMTSDPFGFVAAAAHANDLKPSFYYSPQFASGIRGLTL